MTTSTESATDIASKTLMVKITGRDADGQLTYTTSPASITFHAKHAPRLLKCRIDEDSIPGKFEFVGYTYDAANVQVGDSGLQSPKLDLTFQFNGQTVTADLIFQITDENKSKSRPSDVDPQVGNNPPPDMSTTLPRSIVKSEGQTNAVTAGDSASIATTLTIYTHPDGSFDSYGYSNLNNEGAFEFPRGSTQDNLTVTLAVDKPAYAGRYYISEYYSSVVQPTPDPAPESSGQFGVGTTSVVFAFTFSTTASDQTYFAVYVTDTGTDPSSSYECDPQVGNNPPPD